MPRPVLSGRVFFAPRATAGLSGRALFSPAGGMATLAWPCFAWWVSPPPAPCRMCHGRSCPAVCFSLRRVAWPRLRGHVLRGGYPHPPRRAACATAGLSGRVFFAPCATAGLARPCVVQPCATAGLVRPCVVQPCATAGLVRPCVVRPVCHGRPRSAFRIRTGRCCSFPDVPACPPP